MENTTQITNVHFRLSSQQRRLRHLRCLALRSLCWPGHKGKDLANLQSFFTLHEDGSSYAFYTSEQILGSLNPTWQSFDISRYEEKISTRSRSIVLKIWVGVKNKFELLIDWEVNLMGLMFFADKLQETVKYANNSVIFGMFDKYFVAPDENFPETTEPIYSMMNVDSTNIRNSYRTSSVSRIYTVLRATKQTQTTVNKYHGCIEDKLLSSQETTFKLSNREGFIMKRTQMRNELAWQLSGLQSAKEYLIKIGTINRKRENGISENFLQLKRKKQELLEQKKKYNQTRENFIKEEAQWKIRRKQLIEELATNVYPITDNKKKDNFICNVKLPDSENFQGSDDTQIAVALGYTSHMVFMMSHILDFPMRYPIEHRGSRSQITDHIHHKLTEKDNTFPLYSKGKEKFYFNYGVYLLNKDIGQLRFYCGMGTADLRTTLQNVKTLLELRLGTKLDSKSKRLKPSTGNTDKAFSDIDTQSSVASGGRLSIPDSSDLLYVHNVFNQAKRDRLSDNGTLSLDKRKDDEDNLSNDITFHPSPDDNFFKISNPVSDKSNIFYDLNSVEDSVIVSEPEDVSCFRHQYEGAASYEYKLRTDSNITTDSSEHLSTDCFPKKLTLESQISNISTTDYHQKLSNRLQNTEHSSNMYNVVPSSTEENNQIIYFIDGENSVSDEPTKSDMQYTDITLNSMSHPNHDILSKPLSKIREDSLQTDCQKHLKSPILYEGMSATTQGESFPEIRRTFQTLSSQRSENKHKICRDHAKIDRDDF